MEGMVSFPRKREYSRKTSYTSAMDGKSKVENRGFKVYIQWVFSQRGRRGDITMADNNNCPFCNIEPDRIRYEDAYCFTVRDGYPVAISHSLIIPKRHIASFFETTKQEKEALMNALELAKTELDCKFIPDAYNIGINDGSAAGQTVPHLHIHLIPRYRGDVPDPRGGVRCVIPDKVK